MEVEEEGKLGIWRSKKDRSAMPDKPKLDDVRKVTGRLRDQGIRQAERAML